MIPDVLSPSVKYLKTLDNEGRYAALAKGLYMHHRLNVTTTILARDLEAGSVPIPKKKITIEVRNEQKRNFIAFKKK
jgi:hypothetical protein